MNSSSEEIEICALKKPFTNSDLDKPYNLVSLEPYDGCSPYEKPEDFSNTAVLLRISRPFSCEFAVVINNLQALKPSVVLIGSDGPLVTT